MNQEIYKIIPYNGYYYGYYYPIISRAVVPFNPNTPIAPSHPPIHIPHFEYLSESEIDRKYRELIKKGFVGTPITPESITKDGHGRFRHYRGSGRDWSIYWHPKTGAHEVHGAIRDKWASIGWEFFGYPATDELTTLNGGGRFNNFHNLLYNIPNRSIVFKFGHDRAYAVSNPIWNKWAELGGVGGSLGYPISDEVVRPDGWRFQRFEKGAVIWSADTAPYVGDPTTLPVPTTPTTPTTPPLHPPTQGYSKVSIYNCHTDRRSITIWVNDGSGLHPVTTLDPQYNDYGTCPAGEPYVLDLKDGLWNHIVCVDVGAIGCGVNDPTQVACKRYEFSVLGNSNGPESPPVVVY
ncbi:hypothetical protein GK047_25120 [Paenibacillus sp. SYP-B3998]|uniref:LGFP repeat-containing protein n=1 Tax=Paenibacillus sp. SYP-B3998 TaxID=2678564 RepID=A0A6G4A4N2_9BACL|nr:hypothetical protein [Paenibacillus sp. SYP-B3998]NEW09248.1 hypothetical protein [Paenibacillus sp. SYP-B3998]